MKSKDIQESNFKIGVLAEKLSNKSPATEKEKTTLKLVQSLDYFGLQDHSASSPNVSFENETDVPSPPKRTKRSTRNVIQKNYEELSEDENTSQSNTTKKVMKTKQTQEDCDFELSDAEKDSENEVLEIPVKDVQAKRKSKGKSRQKKFVEDELPDEDVTAVIWEEKDLEENIRPSILAEDNCDSLGDPISYFKYFFDSEILQHVTDMSNLYHMQQHGKPLNLTVAELERFIGIWIYMGVCSLPSMRDYWHTECRVNQVANVMSFNRFQRIRASLHIVNNETLQRGASEDEDDPEASEDGQMKEVDRLFKIRKLVEHIRLKCQSLPQESRFSIDEIIVPYKGKYASTLRQYIKSKPHKWGFKLFGLAGVSGIIYDFFMYIGKPTFSLQNVGRALPAEVVAMGSGAQAVVSLCQAIKAPHEAIVFFDNWFTGLRLLNYLKKNMNILSLGTIRQNRTGGCPLIQDKELLKEGRGAHHCQVNSEGIAVVKWADNKVVCLASNVAGVEPQGKLKRFNKEAKSKINVSCPRIIELYNAHMGGVDKSDMMVELNRLPTRSKRWYFALIGYLIDLALVNSYLLYRRQATALGEKQEFKSSKDFRLQVAKSLCVVERQRGRPSSSEKFAKKKDLIVSPRYRPCNEVRYDGEGHLPSFSESQGRCKNCKNNKTMVTCTKCEVLLCFRRERNCFVQFHTKPANGA